MLNPNRVKACVETYFGSLPVDTDGKITPENTPTPEGLARSAGFSNFNSMRKAIEDPDMPEESRHYLLSGCSMVAEFLTKCGMFEAANPSFVKFIMSAQLGISERTEVHNVNDTRVVIAWEKPEEEQTQADIIELDRLESALPVNMQLPTSQLVEPTIEDLF